MSELNALFRQRIGIPQDADITFETLGLVLEQTARSIPFENLCILEKNLKDITREHLINKILVHKEGGLCYELNGILYLFLLDNGFMVTLASGVVYKAGEGYSPTGRTHLTILLTHGENRYLVDTGFGGNLPLVPVPLTGETVTSANGEFRIKNVQSEHGDYVLEMKLRHKDKEWRIGYAFDSVNTSSDFSECNRIQAIIAEHDLSAFNKTPLLTKMTKEGSVTVTNTSFTQWADGVMTKESIDEERYKQLLQEHFGIV